MASEKRELRACEGATPRRYTADGKTKQRMSFKGGWGVPHRKAERVYRVCTSMVV